MKKVVKDWGIELWRHNDANYCIKWLIICPGWRCSEHFHPVKTETFIVLEGSCVVEVNGQQQMAYEGDQFEIPAGTRHWFGVCETEAPCTLLEVSTFHSDTDVVRLRPSEPFKWSTSDIIARMRSTPPMLNETIDL